MFYFCLTRRSRSCSQDVSTYRICRHRCCRGRSKGVRRSLRAQRQGALSLAPCVACLSSDDLCRSQQPKTTNGPKASWSLVQPAPTPHPSTAFSTPHPRYTKIASATANAATQCVDRTFQFRRWSLSVADQARGCQGHRQCFDLVRWTVRVGCMRIKQVVLH